jgi:hypothetical protein
MSKYERFARVEGIDESSGVFSATLATEGEASDGHILSIKGGHIPERMPLLVSHWNDPHEQAGSITNPKKHLKDAPPRVSVTGHIEMSGEGAPAEIRRDLAHMIAKGHVGAMSIRWDEVPGKTVRRINLPSDHPHYVDPEKAKGAERWGLFFEEWRGLEGSIVSIGADPGALIGRANETTGEVQQFWRAMAGDLEEGEKPDVEIELELTKLTADGHPVSKAIADQIRDEMARPEPTEESKQAAAVAALREAAEQARALGLENEIAETIGIDIPTAPEHEESEGAEETPEDSATLRHILDRLCRLEKCVTAPSPTDDQGRVLDDPPASTERVKADPLSVSTEELQRPENKLARLSLDTSDLRGPLDVEAFGQFVSKALDEFEGRIQRRIQSILDLHAGKVSP